MDTQSLTYSGWLQAVGVGWGEKLEDDIDLDPPSMRQAIAWSFALRNIRRMETEEAGQQLLRTSGADSVRDVKAGVTCWTILIETVRLKHQFAARRVPSVTGWHSHGSVRYRIHDNPTCIPPICRGTFCAKPSSREDVKITQQHNLPYPSQDIEKNLNTTQRQGKPLTLPLAPCRSG